MKKLVFFSLVGAFSVCAYAADIVRYDMLGQPGNQVSTAGVSDFAEITVSPLSRGTGLTASAGANSLNSSGWALGDGDDANDYVTFGFTVAGGFQANLQNFFIGSRSSDTGPSEILLKSSLDGYTATIASIPLVGASAFTNSIIDLSGGGPSTGSIEFRFYAGQNVNAIGTGTIGNGGTWRIADYFQDGTFGDVNIVGTVIPEPASVLLVAFGALCLIRRR